MQILTRVQRVGRPFKGAKIHTESGYLVAHDNAVFFVDTEGEQIPFYYNWNDIERYYSFEALDKSTKWNYKVEIVTRA